MPDEKPETHTDPPAEPPATPPATPPADPPKPPSSGGDIPEWGKELSGKVDGILEALKPPMPEHGEEVGDKTPVRAPWHKRGLFGGGQ